MLVAFISRKLECKLKCFLCAHFIRASLSKTESKINVVSKLLLRQRSRIQFAPYWYIIKYWSVSSRKTVVLPQASQVHSESLSETINWNSRGKTSRKTSNCRKPKNTSIFFTILMPFISFNWYWIELDRRGLPVSVPKSDTWSVECGGYIFVSSYSQ